MTVPRFLASVKTSAALLGALALLMLLNVALPQQVVLGPEEIARLATASPARRFLLGTLGLGHLPTSPLFLGVLALFLANLLVVLGKRTALTFRQARLGNPTEDELLRRTGSATARTLPRAPGWSPADAMNALADRGYRTVRIGDSGLWAVRHRTAPLGFLLFHASFLLLFAGGALLYFTRSVAAARLVEGQTLDVDRFQVRRRAPLGGPHPFSASVTRIEPKFERGEPVDLAVTFSFPAPGGGAQQVARVNHPARLGPARILVDEAGLAPELWLLDGKGFTLDRVSVAANGPERDATVAPLLDGALRVTVVPQVPPGTFPEREALGAVPVRIEIRAEPPGPPSVEGILRTGERIRFGDRDLELHRLRPWVSVRLVEERGGGLLVLGFVLATFGLVWRMITDRRDVAVRWDASAIRVAGRAAFYPARFEVELDALAAALAAPPGDTTEEGGVS